MKKAMHFAVKQACDGPLSPATSLGGHDAGKAKVTFMHVQIIPPFTAIDPEEEVEDNLRLAYRTTPPRGLPPRLQELLGHLRAAIAEEAEEPPRPQRRPAARMSRL